MNSFTVNLLALGLLAFAAQAVAQETRVAAAAMPTTPSTACT